MLSNENGLKGPKVLDIPLALLRPNPHQPRRSMRPEGIQEMAESLKAVGQQTPLKVRPLTAEEKARYSPCEYLVIGGHRRLAGAQKAGLASLSCLVMEIPPLDTHRASVMDNSIEEMDWWDWDLAIEEESKVTGLSQREVAQRLGVSVGKVNGALSIMKLLNPAARKAIDENLKKSLISGVQTLNTKNKGFSITELHLLALAELGDPDKVLKALLEVLDDYLTVAETKKLVQKGSPQSAVDGRQPAKAEKPEIATSASAPIGAPPRNDDGEEESSEEEFKPIPWSEASKHPEYLTILVARVRVNPTIEIMYAHSSHWERTALSMKTTGHAREIWVRRLTEEEKKTDLDHDYELFDNLFTLKAAQKLGWTNLTAMVYNIDEWEGIRLHNNRVRYSRPLTWMQLYVALEKALVKFPQKTLREWAIALEEDPAEVEKVFPVMKLLNDATRKAISQSESRCYEEGIDMGGYRFVSPMMPLLGKLEGHSKDLTRTQQLVEKVVRVAIDNEMWLKDLSELVDWALAGNDPAEFYEPASQGV